MYHQYIRHVAEHRDGFEGLLKKVFFLGVKRLGNGVVNRTDEKRVAVGSRR